ncbi:hypothetical protein [Empedobacter brevis]|uniref:hypothetical protein n=1 Tax=Empedobacter brevis TaxID=247 RepID=UPI0028A25F45|nr:hypothetical protein [Empedobacter brevis]
MIEIIILILYFVLGNFLAILFLKIFVTKKYIKPFLSYNNISNGKIVFLFFNSGYFEKRKKTIITTKSGNIFNTVYFNVLNTDNTNVIFTVKVEIFFLFIKDIHIKNDKEIVILK